LDWILPDRFSEFQMPSERLSHSP